MLNLIIKLLDLYNMHKLCFILKYITQPHAVLLYVINKVHFLMTLLIKYYLTKVII